MKKYSVYLLGLSSLQPIMAQVQTPNIIYIMADDHSAQAISAYGGILADILPTPNISRIAREGVKMNNCFVTNSISTPSRGAIMTGQYSNKNGIYTLDDKLDPAYPNVAKCLRKSGYQTAIIGKWHLGNEPTGFDYYNVLPGQGRYYNPYLIEKGMWGDDPRSEPEGKKEYQGHSTDVITDEAIRFMDRTSKDNPFFLMCHYKAPHRWWEPAKRFKELLKEVKVPEPENLLDTYEGKGKYAELLTMSMEHLNTRDLKTEIPEELSRDELRRWAYQIYIKDYLRCIAGIDENVGRILNYLDEKGLAENTIVIYTSDQGFFLGEHGWFDKRLIYEESLRMPFLIRYPKEIEAGVENNDIVLNIDFAPLFLDYANVEKPLYMQGESFRDNLRGRTQENWRKSMYYRYWMHAEGTHHVTAHYGLRTHRYKLIFYYGQSLGMKGANDKPLIPAEWELYDLMTDPSEMKNIYDDPSKKDLINDLKLELLRLKRLYEDEDSAYPQMKEVIDTYFW
ncbi:MAG: sulfatase [Tannerellaceae bacterium]|jgi:arylsulfatase A-like enzyme|nr:sulfatase [Tannerellaceae bacterium]